jgi:hypothetical protein
MKVAGKTGRRLTMIALCIGLSACVDTTGQQPGLFYRPPTASGQTAIPTTKSPVDIAQILLDAGLGTVRSDATSVTLSSTDARLIDCGTFVQVAMGNRAEFPANAPSAVLMEGFATPGLIQRGIASRSTVRLVRQSDGSGYVVSESHEVTCRYEAVATGARSSFSVNFDATSVGEFANKTSCRSSGFVGSLLR